MKIEIIKPKVSISKTYLKERVLRPDIEKFKQNFKTLLEHLEQSKNESEEHYKDFIADFLKNTFYSPNFFINTKKREDLTIRTGKDVNDNVAVIFETKMPNSSEMISNAKPNTKALQQLIYYYFEERMGGNIEVKNLIITDIYNWYIFDENDFRKCFYDNAKLKKGYETVKSTGKSTAFFYSDVAKPILDEMDISLKCTHFNLNDYKKIVSNEDKTDDNALIALYKLLSPVHLLKLPFANDSNSLDKNFYAELLHIIGLEEVKEGSKKLIQRKKIPDEYSLLENTITKIESKGFYGILELNKYGSSREEQTFAIALELCITWINRILFLKLLEAQLVSYHRGDTRFKFLNKTLIRDFDRLDKLFFEVLAEKNEERKGKSKTEFAHIPYLNSSLFERTDLERKAIEINALDNDEEIPLFANTVLKNDKDKKQVGTLPTLKYLLDFLEAYDFTSEGKEDIQEDKKALINASVLGLIFEKINGYKDGSFFTPGFITMYMCRETIRKAVLQKFQDNGYKAATFEELEDEITDRKAANDIINSLKICDPAVGSGHFLVSALNEIIAIKADLGVLCYRNGKRVKDYKFEVENDELVVTDEDTGDLFQYYLNDKGVAPSEVQAIQEMLFHEKQSIIENCLFGVDINPNSVKICRLRLWIELLKNAYYKTGDVLETLPNIDINIKCGNSLISRFKLNDDISEVFKKQKFSLNAYKKAVDDYKNTNSKTAKYELQNFIDEIKEQFQTFFNTSIKEYKDLAKFKGQLFTLQNQGNLFDAKIDTIEQDRLSKLIVQSEQKVNDIKDNIIYKDAFEWRFEFPEVLDNDGNFLGFDAVIGNPPYIRQEEFKEIKKQLENNFELFVSSADLYVYFVELGLNLLRKNGSFSYIIPNKWMKAAYGKTLRHFLKVKNIISIIDFGDLPVFEEASTYPCILFIENSKNQEVFTALKVKSLIFEYGLKHYFLNNKIQISPKLLSDDSWSMENDNNADLIVKIKLKGKPLSEYLSGKIFYGIKTGCNEAFVIDEETKADIIRNDDKCKIFIKPLLGGKDVKRYEQPIATKYLIYSKKGIEIEKYPTIFSHLNKFKHILEKKAGANKWYELQASPSDDVKFENIKITYPDISKNMNFILDNNSNYSLNTIYNISSDSKSLLGFLNSKLFGFYFQNISNSIRGGYLRFFSDYMNVCPIPDNLECLELLVEQILLAKKNNEDTTALEREIDTLVYALYDLTAEEIEIIEQSVNKT